MRSCQIYSCKLTKKEISSHKEKVNPYKPSKKKKGKKPSTGTDAHIQRLPNRHICPVPG
jgi:hypothetical protein